MNNTLKIKTLIVDDEQHIIDKATNVIQSTFEDYVIVAKLKNGKEALTYIETHNIDLLITDIRMPEMTGLELAEHLKLNFPHIKTIIFTAYSEFEYAKKAIQLHVVDFILKPIVADDLIKILAELLVTFSSERNEAINLPLSPTLGTEETFILIQKYIQDNYLENISLTEIAKKFNFSQAYLTKIFMKYTGNTPLKYKTSLRMSAAKDYLCHTEMTVSEIAERLNYSDQFTFSKAFKKHENISPQVFRKSNLNSKQL